ncbi:hypothetical protein AGOR_G00225990 [Albula goreensis]|uniref:AAA+ ATPase domain-containing protein n=1 Tax=Albula goreensis TaxID=1534307 RepID=A0A8T3CKC6_9TELE|nr:hypothetical protein AGOR_G00225990 [Albula goreensis]
MDYTQYDNMDLYTEGALTLKFQSVISQSKQINQGPPEKRLLNTVREELDDTGKIRKWTFGEENQSKTRTILMMGETGTGKSTLINVMVNYILGVEWKDDIRFEIIEEEERCQTESQTTAVTVYEIYGQEDEQYERASGEKATAESLERNLQEDLRKVESGKIELIEDSYQHIVKLDMIALRPESGSTLQHLDFLIERFKETGNAEKVQKLEDMKTRAGKVNKDK